MQLNKTLAKIIIERFKEYLMHMTAESPILMAFLLRILNGFDHTNGLYVKPLNLSKQVLRQGQHSHPFVSFEERSTSPRHLTFNHAL